MLTGSNRHRTIFVYKRICCMANSFFLLDFVLGFFFIVFCGGGGRFYRIFSLIFVFFQTVDEDRAYFV